MIKLIGFIAIISSTTLFGFSKVSDLHSRERKLSLIIYMLDEMEILLKYKAYIVFELINELTGNRELNNIEFIKHIRPNISKTFSQQWSESLELSDNDLNKNDKRIIKSLGDALGNSDLDGQIATIKLFRENLKKRLNESEKKTEQNAKLYSSMGVLSGIFISILLI